MSVREYGGAVIDIIKDSAKNWIKSKSKIIAVVLVAATSIIFLPIIRNNEWSS